MIPIQIKNLSLSIGLKPILHHVSLSLQPGDFAALMGPNGSGKTSLIRLLSGVYRNYQGEIYLGSENLCLLSPRQIAQNIAVLPQEAHFAFPFCALEIVLMGRHPYQKGFGFDTPHDLEVARCAMEQTNSWQFRNRSIETLSGGEKQRVLLARALAQKPKVLLLDEPSSHLDLKHRRALFSLLAELNYREGLTILCVVHDPNLASLYCRQVLLLKEGTLIFRGLVQEVLTPENLEHVFETSFEPVTLSNGGRLFY